MSTLPQQRETRGAAVAFARLTARLDWLAAQTCICLFVVILGTMVLQVSFRYLLNAPLVWTEELARMCYIWACFIGAPVALRRGSHVSVTFLAERVPTRVMAGVSLVLNGVALIFLAQLGLQGTHLTIQSHHLETITLPIPWSAIYIAAPVSALLMILETIRLIWLGPIPAAKTEASI